MVFDSGDVTRGSSNAMDVDTENFETHLLSGPQSAGDSYSKAEFNSCGGADSEIRSKVKATLPQTRDDLELDLGSRAGLDDLKGEPKVCTVTMQVLEVRSNNNCDNDQTMDARLMQDHPACSSSKDNGLPEEEENDRMDYSQNDDISSKSDDVTIKSDDDDDEDESSEGETICSDISNFNDRRGRKDFAQNGRSLRSRRNRRPVQERIRQRRQTMQDMARPLKHWLYKNRSNPYPTKAQKVELAHSSHMTLTQVSNWFANARRRLKNTVTDPFMNWDDRVINYNDYVKGNAELLSISSGDEEEEEEETSSECAAYDVSNRQPAAAATCRISVATSHTNRERETEKLLAATAHIRCQHQPGEPVMAEETGNTNSPIPVPIQGQATANAEGTAKNELEQKFMVTSTQECNSLLHRYLQDSWQHFPNQEEDCDRRRHQSGSLSSHDFEDMSISSRGSPTHCGSDDYPHSLEELTKYWEECADRVDDLYWKEISAALTLTSLARSKQRLGNPQ